MAVCRVNIADTLSTREKERVEYIYYTVLRNQILICNTNHNDNFNQVQIVVSCELKTEVLKFALHLYLILSLYFQQNPFY